MHGAIVDVLKRSYASLWRFSDTGGQFDDRRSLPAPRADIVQLELTVPLENPWLAVTGACGRAGNICVARIPHRQSIARRVRRSRTLNQITTHMFIAAEQDGGVRHKA